MMRKVRVRFAPSPTGPLHIGGVRTALYNYIFAKKHGGDFILRIEDTDTARTVPGAEEYIIESLKWAGITPNEGVGFSTFKMSNELYRQSDRNRLEVYKPYSEKLLADGNAYIAFDTTEEIDAIKASIKASGSKNPFAYGVFTREKMKNSLTLSKEEVESRIKNGDSYVVRIKMPMGVEIKFKDIIRGDINVKSHTIDDKVLFKSDGMPTYHLANVVDDYEMKISHVIRGEEWLPSAPLHVMLYKFLGIENVMPEFAHLPLIMGPNGKLSKRDGDTLGFPVYPMKWTDPVTGETSSGYKESGYLVEAFNNMIALLGWSPGNNIEIMTMDEMLEKFSLEKIGKSGAKFDLKKAEWVNHQHMMKTDDRELMKIWMPLLKEEKEFVGGFSPSYITSVCGLLKEKVSNISKFWESGKYFFVTPIPTLDSDNSFLFADLIASLSSLESFDHDSIKNAFNESVVKYGEDARNAGKALRTAITGMPVGPPIFDIIALLGKTESLNRIASNIKVFNG